jgi:Domain of unknown function (DUF4394)
MKKSKKTFIGMTVLALALAAISAVVLMGRHSVSAAAAPSASIAAQANGWQQLYVYALTSDSMLYVMAPNTNVFLSLGRVSGIGGGDLIGIDTRPADGKLYGLTDTGRLYTINVGVSPPVATLVSSLSPRFPSGFQSLMDFNPVVDAIRAIGSNTRNYAVVKSAAGILNTTAVQTDMAYAAGDVNAGKVPAISAGAYTNNVNGAQTTIFYAFDYDQDTLVTVPVGANGSSATGGGQLQTIGSLRDIFGNLITVNPTCDMDIVTAGGINNVIAISRNIFFTLDLGQVNPNLPIGTTQNVFVRGFNTVFSPAADSIIDIAASMP